MNSRIETITVKPPRPSDQVRSMQQHNTPGTDVLLCELIDNAIDGSATNIDVRIKGRSAGTGTFAIQDDGCGIESLSKLLRIGASDKFGDSSQIGRYGVGAKSCFWIAGGYESVLHIESRHAHGAWRSTIQWQHQHSDEYVVEQEPDWATKPLGTHIQMRAMKRVMPDAPELRRKVAKIYWPWLLRKTNRLCINGEQVTPLKLPATDRCLDNNILDAGDGREIVLRGGIKSSIKDPLFGVWVAMGDRMIYTDSRVGIGVNNNPAGIFVYAELRGPWDVSLNKAGLDESEHEVLHDILAEHLDSLMEKASDAAMQFELREFNATLNALWSGSDVGRGKRNTQGKGQGEGVKPTGTGPQHREAKDITPSSEGVVRRRNGRRLPFNKWKLQAVGGDPEIIGTVDAANHIINYHTNNSVVEKFQNDKNYDALLTACAGILVNTLEDGLPFDGRWANTLSQVLVERLNDKVQP